MNQRVKISGAGRALWAAFAAVLGLALPASVAASPPEALRQASILPGWTTDTGAHMAALHITLAPGWKTYWRAPGESGIPPRLDFSGSVNLAEARAHWPVPSVIEGAGLRTIGYTGELLLPIEAVPLRAGAPVELVADIEIGICDDICVPVSLRLSADLPGDRSDGGPGRGTAHAAPIAAALASRPLSAGEAGLGAVRCTVEPVSDGLRLHADIETARAAEAAAVELPDPGIWVSQAVLAPGAAGLRVSADLVPPPGQPLALDRSAVTITLLGGSGAVEIRGCAAG